MLFYAEFCYQNAINDLEQMSIVMNFFRRYVLGALFCLGSTLGALQVKDVEKLSGNLDVDTGAAFANAIKGSNQLEQLSIYLGLLGQESASIKSSGGRAYIKRGILNEAMQVLFGTAWQKTVSDLLKEAYPAAPKSWKWLGFGVFRGIGSKAYSVRAEKVDIAGVLGAFKSMQESVASLEGKFGDLRQLDSEGVADGAATFVSSCTSFINALHNANLKRDAIGAALNSLNSITVPESLDIVTPDGSSQTLYEIIRGLICNVRQSTQAFADKVGNTFPHA